MLFHIFWLLFYFLTAAPFLLNGEMHIYFKFFVINSVGFITFCISAFLLFPYLSKSKKYFWVIAVSFVIIVAFGYIQFSLQDWHPVPFFINNVTPVTDNSNGLALVTLRQLSGANIRAMLNILVYLLLGFGYAYMEDWFIKDRRTRILEKEKVSAELALLRYQLNPHFLFNTINDIYYLAIIKSEKTAEAILKVSELLRYVLDHKSEMVSLENELDHLKKFLKLQEFRFPDQIIDFKLNIQDNINNYEIAPLLLTTFAENAFKHGEPGTEETPVKINVSLANEVLTYLVSNKINRRIEKDSSTGIGLNNLKRRLSLLYPGRYDLTIKEDENFFYANLQLELS